VLVGAASDSNGNILADTAPCTLCQSGDPISLPERSITLPEPFNFLRTCEDVDAILGIAAAQGDEACRSMQAIGSYCGCPALPQGCHLCGSDGLSRILPALAEKEVAFDLPGIVSTCGIVQAFLESSVDQDSDMCLADGDVWQGLCKDCGCQVVDEVPLKEAPRSNENNNKMCSLCANQQPVGYPERDIAFVLGDRFDLPAGTNATCRVVDILLQTAVASDTDDCQQAQFLAGLCGCPPIQENFEPCDYCPGEDLPDPDRIVDNLRDYGVPPMSCRDLKDFMTVVEATSSECRDMHTVRYWCGCNDGYVDHGGVDNDFQAALMEWVPRIIGMLSGISCLCIIRDIMQRRTGGALSLYQQLMFAMSAFLLFESLAWSFAAYLVPTVTEDGDPTGFRGAHGNQATCTAQAFSIQLGLIGQMYHIPLSIYFLLSIGYAWRESALRKAAIWFHAPLLIVGLGLAFGGLPFYSYTPAACWMPVPPLTNTYAYILIWAVFPLSIMSVTTTTSVVLIYQAVRTTRSAGRRWRFEIREGNDQLERDVFWQCVWYLMPHIIVWPVVLAGLLGAGKVYNYVFWVFFNSISPSQGLWNGIVYSRPRIQAYWRERRRQNQRLASSTATSRKRSLRPSSDDLILSPAASDSETPGAGGSTEPFSDSLSIESFQASSFASDRRSTDTDSYDDEAQRPAAAET
jgi:hypothetical protein